MSKLGLTISILADASKLRSGLDDAGKSVEVFGRSIDVGMVAKLGAVGAVVGTAVVAISKFTEAAVQDAAEAERLAVAIEAAGAAHGEWAAQVDAAIISGQALAFTDTQIRDALVPLVGATGDVAAATELMGAAQDIARLKGVDLETAAQAVSKAYQGNATQLARLVGVSAAGKDATEVLEEAMRLAAGQAEAYGNTLEGQTEAAKIGFDEFTETLGSLFIPILAAVIPAITPVLQALSELVVALLPVLTPLLQAVAAALRIVANVVVTVARALADLVSWVSSAIAAIGRLVSAINPLKGLGNIVGNIAGAIGGRTNRAGTGGGLAGQGGALTVNVYGGDPRLVTRAVAAGFRDWTRTNGATAPLGRTW